MHKTVQNLIDIKNKIKSSLSAQDNFRLPKIIAVSKTFKIENILPLIDSGHIHFGENKVQEAVEKWTKIKENKPDLQLHMLGKLQSNKVKSAVKLFDFIHSVDSEKLANKICSEQSKIKRNLKVFIQVNIGNENQKSGIQINFLENLIKHCKKINLDLVGLMCIPPLDSEPKKYFKEMHLLNKEFGFSELSMGMSSDYLIASENFSTYLRIGSSIFGQRF